MHLFFFLDSALFSGLLQPVLAASWRQKSFAPAQALPGQLPPKPVRDVSTIYSPDAVFPKLGKVAFSRELWRLLAAELFLECAAEVTQLEMPLETYAKLLGQKLALDRMHFSLIQQAVLGSQDVVLGPAFYHPETAGLNDLKDIARLSAWLTQVNMGNWNVEALLPGVPGLCREGAQDELAFATDWFDELCRIYRRACDRKFVLISEEV
jgi:hypothetical protein